MRKADFRKEGVLNEKNLQLIFIKKKKIFEDLLKIPSAEEFFDVFDDDEVIIFQIKNDKNMIEINYFLNC